MVFILFDFILNIPVNNFSVMSAHSTKIKTRGSREGWQRVLASSMEHWKPLRLVVMGDTMASKFLSLKRT